MATTRVSPAFSGEVLERFAGHIRGPIIKRTDPVYDRIRALYNAMIDKRPELIVQASDVADVVATVNFARDNALLLAIRGGGHNGGGLGSCDDGIMLDLSRMDGVRVDPTTRTARVEGGATFGQVDHATHAFSLAVPAGIISTTGVGGLTLGGGIGYLSRKYGLSIDNLIGVDMVLADGRFVTASAQENPDLFWAVRGGGGNFGVVTAFLFQLHPVHTVIAGPTFWSLDKTHEVMSWYRDFIVQAPEDLNGFFAFLTVPPIPVFPADIHGEKVAAVIWCYTGPPEQAPRIFAPVQAMGPPLMHGVGPMPYPALQSMFDPLLPPGLQWYWRADFFDDIPDAAIDQHLKYAQAMPTALSTAHLYPIDGAVHRVGRQDTAFNYRDSTWASVYVGIDPDPANAGVIKEWSTGYQEALHPFSAGGAYVNFMMEEGQERVRATYRDNYDRLARIKATYDPHNLFRVNQNIRPA